MSSLDRFLIISVVLLASVFPVELFPNTGPVPRGGDGQFSGKQGQVVVVTVPDLKDVTSVKGQFLGRTVTLFPNPAAGGTGGPVPAQRVAGLGPGFGMGGARPASCRVRGQAVA